MHKTILALVVVVLGSTSQAEAIPMVSNLDDVVKSATTVVVASFIAPTSPGTATGYDLVVERALRGSAAPNTKLRVKAAWGGHAWFSNGTRLVAFVDKTGTFMYAATLAAGTTLETGVLRVAGFNDGNSHAVLPGILTLEQLDALVAKGTPPAWTFRGKVLVASASGPIPSAIDVTAAVPSSRVTGMPAMTGFTPPVVAVGSGAGTDAVITWKRSSTNVFALVAEVTGKNADGSISVTWKPLHPKLRTEAELRAYLANPRRD